MLSLLTADLVPQPRTPLYPKAIARCKRKQDKRTRAMQPALNIEVLDLARNIEVREQLEYPNYLHVVSHVSLSEVIIHPSWHRGPPATRVHWRPEGARAGVVEQQPVCSPYLHSSLVPSFPLALPLASRTCALMHVCIHVCLRVCARHACIGSDTNPSRLLCVEGLVRRWMRLLSNNIRLQRNTSIRESFPTPSEAPSGRSSKWRYLPTHSLTEPS